MRLSPDQCSHSPAWRVTRFDGSPLASGPMSTGLPVRTSGVIQALNFSVKAIHFSSGDSRTSVK